MHYEQLTPEHYAELAMTLSARLEAANLMVESTARDETVVAGVKKMGLPFGLFLVGLSSGTSMDQDLVRSTVQRAIKHCELIEAEFQTTKV